jgi:hypothetical protein
MNACHVHPNKTRGGHRPFRFDPEDESLIWQWAKEDALRYFVRTSKALALLGGSPDEALCAYAKAHFAREPKTFYSFTDPMRRK